MRDLATCETLAATWSELPFDDETRAKCSALLASPSDGSIRTALTQAERAERLLGHFGADLTFGTAGLRAVMGVGTNRANSYTFAAVTRAIAQVLKTENKNSKDTSVVIGYDGRQHSDSFARQTAAILSKEGFHIYLFDRIVPTPVVPFAVTRLKARLGVMITSSHNSAEYNGYKVYNQYGGQITSPFDRDVMVQCKNQKPEKIPTLSDTDVEWLREDMLRIYIDWVLKTANYADDKKIKIVYTPLHGAAGALTRSIFYKAGFINFQTVNEQADPHIKFPTVKAPNPENADSWQLAFDLSHQIQSDVVLANDGDGDRIGVGYLKNDRYTVLTGNQTGTLLLYYLLKKLKATGVLSNHDFALSTVVSTPLAKKICEYFSIRYIETLTGFKNMGEAAEAACAQNPTSKMILAFEEAFGVTMADSRDKDGMVSALLAASIASEFQGRGISHYLDEIESRFGVYREDQIDVEFAESDGPDKMKSVVEKIRAQIPNQCIGEKVVRVRDFKKRTEVVNSVERSMTAFAEQNLIHLETSEGSWIAVRPSGTEPKLKVYLGVVIQSNDASKDESREIKALQKLELLKIWVNESLLS